MEEETREGQEGMTLESFVKIHKDDAPMRTLDLLIDTTELLANARVNRMDAGWRGNNGDAAYYDHECQHMMNRICWIRDRLARDLKRLEEYDAASIGEVERQDILNCVAYVLQKT